MITSTLISAAVILGSSGSPALEPSPTFEFEETGTVAVILYEDHNGDIVPCYGTVAEENGVQFCIPDYARVTEGEQPNSPATTPGYEEGCMWNGDGDGNWICPSSSFYEFKVKVGLKCEIGETLVKDSVSGEEYCQDLDELLARGLYEVNTFEGLEREDEA